MGAREKKLDAEGARTRRQVTPYIVCVRGWFVICLKGLSWTMIGRLGRIINTGVRQCLRSLSGSILYCYLCIFAIRAYSQPCTHTTLAHTRHSDSRMPCSKVTHFIYTHALTHIWLITQIRKSHNAGAPRA